jgi:hypothetical protein
MRRLLYLATLSMVATLLFAPTALAQNNACSEVQDRVNAGDPSLTPAELLACGLSPEAIGAGPSIGGPTGVGENNACSDLPQGSPEAVACFEELIANMGAVPTATTDQYIPTQPQPQAPATTALPDTGGPALLLPAAGVLLVTGLIGMRLVRRS